MTRRHQMRPGFARDHRATLNVAEPEALEARLLFAAAPSPKEAASAARLSPDLLNLAYEAVAPAASVAAALGGGSSLRATTRGDHIQVDGEQRVAVTLRATNVNAVIRRLGTIGFQPTSVQPKLRFAEGLLPVSSLLTVRSLVGGVGRFALRPTYAPLTQVGAVANQADFVLEADRVRATSPGGVTGVGQRIGVISDSYNALGGAPAGVASGDLPAGIQIIQDSGGTDEGRAMMELVYDLAPGANFAFATANGGEANFANNIRRLADPAQGNTKTIVDDVVYFAEPMFQDGVIAQAIDEVVTTRGVTYFSAAANQGSQGYQSTTFQTAADTLTRSGGALVTGTFYDFNTGAGVDTRQRITIPANGEILLSFQWDDPFYTVAGVDTDLDLFLVDPATGLIVASAEADNPTLQDPVEILAFTNPTAGAKQYDLAIKRFAGPNSTRLRYVNYGSSIAFNEFNSPGPTIAPHAAAANGQGVAAAPYFSQTRPEGFTSTGPMTVLFSPTGSPVAAQTRNAPQITAVDGTNTTFFGGDFEGDGRPNFFGTSAAAPHAAAIAALVRQANPGFTPAQIYSRLQTTARDITAGGASAGFDNLTGFGLVNAFDAVFPTITPASLNFVDGFESGALSTAYETRSTGAGRIVVTTANTPFAGVRHLTLDASIAISDPETGVGNQLSLNEVTLHVNASGAGTKTLSFRQKEFGDEDDVMPASFATSNNSDGVALSVDGVNWFRVVSLTGAASAAAYTPNTFDLTAIAAANAVVLSSDTRIRFQQFDDFPIGSDGFAFDEITVTTTATVTPSPTPGVPDLVASSDTGISAADNLTNRDNGAAGRTLQFDVSGTVAGAIVSVFADGVPVGTATASGTTTTVTTNGAVDLADGTHAFTAQQTASGSLPSGVSSALTVTVDTVAPALNAAASRKTHDLAGDFDLALFPGGAMVVEPRQGGPSKLLFTFNGPVFAADGALSANEFAMTNASFSSATVSSSILTLDLTGAVDTSVVSVTLAGLSDAAGNGLAGASGVLIGSLWGDINGNGEVNVNDVNIAKIRSGQPLTAATFLTDVNSNGELNVNDVNIPKVRSGKALPV
jgi:hypothetical protein